MAIEEVSVEEKVDNFFETEETDESLSDTLSQEGKLPGKEEKTETATEGKAEPKEKESEKKPEESPASTPASRAFAAQRVEIGRLKEKGVRSDANLAETQRRLAFMEEQRKKDIQKADLAEKREKNRIYLEGLKEAGSDNYEPERDRVLREDIVDAVTPPASEDDKIAAKPVDVLPDSEEVADFQERITKTNNKLNTEFPDITSKDSALFKKSQAMLFENNTQDEIDYMLKHNPEMFYTHVKLANTLLENEKLKTMANHTQIEGNRQERILGQGVAHSQGAQQGGADNLTPTQRAWCKEQGYNPKEYAKFAHLGGEQNG